MNNNRPLRMASVKRNEGIVLGTSAALFLVHVLFSQGTVGDARLEIAAGRSSPYVIVIPDSPGRDRIMPAAHLLQTIIQESAGVQLPVVKESDKAEGACAFYLGKTRAAVEAGLPVSEIQGWSYLLRTAGADVFIVGDDGPDAIDDPRTIEHQGTLKGVIAFVEDQWGVRFLLPGEFGRRVPEHDTLSVAGGLDVRGDQRFDYVIGRAPRSDRTFAVALNLFRSTPVLKSYGGHSYYTAVPREVYAETHPEYFALRGVRTPGQNHLCISNPDVQELMLKEMEKQLDKGYQWVELAQTDGYQGCKCEACMAVHKDDAERLWIVHRKLAQEMKKRRPGKKIMILSYSITTRPPSTFTTFPDNVVIQLCSYTPQSFEAWAPFNVDKSVYIYNWGSYKPIGYAPTRTPRYVIEQVRRFLDNRVRGIYLCGGYDAGVGYGLNGPALYAFGKALTHPEREPGDVLDEYVDTLFGEAADPMRSFYRVMYDRLDTYCLFSAPNVDTGGVVSSMKTPEDYYCHIFPAHVLNQMSLDLQRAVSLARDERVQAALTMVEWEFQYVRSIAAILQVYRAYRVNPTPAAFDVLADKIEERKQLLDSMYGPDGKCVQRLPGGLPSCFAPIPRAEAEMNGRTMGLRPPFNWDFTLLKESGVLPGTGKPKRMAVRRVSGITLDGLTDESVWREIPSGKLSEIGLGKTEDATRFKVAYDEHALYLAVECEFTDTAWLDRLKSTGRDGNAWQQECIEISVDPFGKREKHCQLVFSPIADATFDAHRGYIEDPLHPLYGKPDVSWNGDWEYVAHIDRKRKLWTAEVCIPYATLDAEPPVPGALWTLNICRAQYPVPYGGDGYSQAVRYSTWSPNMESRSFHDRASFGELVFE